MADHREAMASWLKSHEAHMAERRAIADGYRELSTAVREAVFAARPLR